MVHDVPKMGLQGSSTSYSAAKDLLLYLKDRTKYIRRLEGNLQKLCMEMGRISSRKEQFDRVLEMSVSKERTNEYCILVDNIQVLKEKYAKFLSKYQELQGDVIFASQNLDASSISKVINTLQERRSSVWTFKFWALAKLSRRIAELHEYVLEVNKGLNKENMTMEKKPESVQVKHGTIYDLPQLEEDVKKVLRYLRSADVNRISIVGPIGVGKTTILKKLNNQLEIADGIVIWINYPDGTKKEEKIVEDIQDQIMVTLKISSEKTMSIDQNSNTISKFLCQKKYILIMDHVSSNIDLQILDKVGIHTEHWYGKIVLAARTRLTINQIKIDREVEVRVLTRRYAWKLFENIYGAIYDKRVRDVGDVIITCCGGLPQVIILVANHLKGSKDLRFWQHVKTKLQYESSPTELGLGGVGQAYKMMYDELDGDNLKKCSLYGALFPCEHKIYNEYLIECWKSEGFFDGKEWNANLLAARRAGVFVLNQLTNRYLLEACCDKYVQMPIYFRTVALEQNYSCEENSSKMWVARLRDELPKEENWSTTRRMSLINQLSTEPPIEGTSQCSTLPVCPQCNNISTLLLQLNPSLQRLEDDFFLNMGSLQVLDLYRTQVELLPSSIKHLKNLVSLYVNECYKLALLPPEAAELLKLEILDVRRTSIKPWFPEEIGRMERLRCLRVSYDHERRNDGWEEKEAERMNPSEIICNLRELEELTIEVNVDNRAWINIANDMAVALAKLEHMTTLRFNFPTLKDLQSFITHSRSWKKKAFDSFRFFVGCQDVSNPFGSDVTGLSAQSHLKLYSKDADIPSVVSEVLSQASAFELIGHPSATSLSDFNFDSMGSLKVCSIGDCNSMATIVDEQTIIEMKSQTEITNADVGVLQSVEKLLLYDLTSLQHIWKGTFRPQSFSSLIVLKISNCPKLTEIPTEIWTLMEEVEIRVCENLIRLSMTRENAKNLASIACEDCWWERLKWQDEQDKKYFTPICHFIAMEEHLVRGESLSNGMMPVSAAYHLTPNKQVMSKVNALVNTSPDAFIDDELSRMRFNKPREIGISQERLGFDS